MVPREWPASPPDAGVEPAPAPGGQMPKYIAWAAKWDTVK